MTAYTRLLLLLTACGLAACSVGPDSSYVAAFSSPADAPLIAANIGLFVKSQLPTASTTIVLEPTPSGQAGNALTPALADVLRREGFAVVQDNAPGNAPAGAHTLRYWVTPLDASGELVRLMIDGRKEASRFFVRNAAGRLQSGGPFTVAQQEAA